MLTQERLKEVLYYNEATGDLTWLEARGNRSIGSVAGTKTKKGYLQIRVDEKFYLAHRLVWMYVHGEFPASALDHINLDRCDNRLANLRLATASQNQYNTGVRKDSVTGVKGVSWHKASKRYKAAITSRGVTTILGYFGTIAEAATAYASAADRLHGDFARARRIHVDATDKTVENVTILGL